MKMTKFALAASISCAASLPAFGMTYKNAYPVPCSEVWGAVKDTLGNPDNYEVKQSEDAKMHAEYKPKQRRVRGRRDDRVSYFAVSQST